MPGPFVSPSPTGTESPTGSSSPNQSSTSSLAVTRLLPVSNPGLIRSLEVAWNMPGGSLLDTPFDLDRIFLSPGLHHLFEQDQLLLIPGRELLRLYLSDGGQQVMKWTQYPVLQASHYDTYECCLLPVRALEKEVIATSMDVTTTGSSNTTSTTDTVHRYPFTTIGPISIDGHVPPHFIIANSGNKLRKHRKEFLLGFQDMVKAGLSSKLQDNLSEIDKIFGDWSKLDQRVVNEAESQKEVEPRLL